MLASYKGKLGLPPELPHGVLDRTVLLSRTLGSVAEQMNGGQNRNEEEKEAYVEHTQQRWCD